jgi:hypothetical protein
MRKVFNTPCQNLMCEKISNNIYKFYKDNNLKTLPLTTELSKQIYEKWNRGDKTEFYKKIEDVK